MVLNRSKNSNHFCGPAAIALLTGVHVDDAARALRIVTGKASIKGATNTAMLRALDNLGYKAMPIHTVPGHNARTGRSKYPTLTQALRVQLRDRDKAQPFLVNITGHYITILGRKLYDNRNPDGVYLGECTYRRKRVKAIWAVDKVREVAPPAKPMQWAGFITALGKLDTRLDSDGSNIDAPQGHVFYGTGTHCLCVTGTYEEALADAANNLPLVPCMDDDCDMCNPEADVEVLL